MVQAEQSVVVTAKLSKVFRDFWMRQKVAAVSELDLQVRPGEVFGLLGPNGSGKTTTLNLLLGLLFPTRGRVAVFGRPPTDVSIKARLGYLPEETHLYPFLDARETLDFYGRLFHQPRQQRLGRIDMLLEMVGLSAVAYRRINEYSKGMQRRIGLAQALINDPDLLILDEPTSGMDPIGTREVKDLIKVLAGRGKTVILSSHLLADVEDVCDRVCILYGGRKRAEGTVEDLVAQRSYTQLTTDRLADETIEQVREVLAAASCELREVTAPRDRLESLFLRVVAEARSKRMVTGGVDSGGEVAAFLRTGRDEVEEGAALIERLVSGQAEPVGPAEAPAEEPVPAEPVEAPQSEVLDDLLTASADAETPPADEKPKPTAPPAPAKPQDQADRSIIDGLLGGDEPEDAAS